MFIFNKKRMNTVNDETGYGMRYDGKLSSIYYCSDYEYLDKEGYKLNEARPAIVDFHKFVAGKHRLAKKLVQYPDFIPFK